MKIDLSKYENLSNNARAKIPELRKYCKTLYLSGKSCAQVAKETSFSESTIHNIAHKDDWKLRRPMRQYLEKVRKIDEIEVLRLRSNGETIGSIAKKFELNSRKPIRDILEKHNIPVKWRITFDSEKLSEAIQLYTLGIGVRGIAERFELDPSTVERNLKLAGVKLRSQLEQNRIIACRKFKQSEVLSREKFSRFVRTLTAYNYKYNKFIINKRNVPLGRDSFVIDHIASIHSGYQYFLRTGRLDTIYLISHPSNLQLISNHENAVKRADSWLTRYELIEKVLDFNSKYICPYARFWDRDEYPIFEWFEQQIGHYEGYYVRKTFKTFRN